MGQGHPDTPAKWTKPSVVSTAKIVDFYCHFASTPASIVMVVIAAGRRTVKIGRSVRCIIGEPGRRTLNFGTRTMNLDGFLPKAIPHRWGVIGIEVVCYNFRKEHAAPKPFVGHSLSSRFPSPFVKNDQVTSAGEG
jgi:hypothetical protein